jgi:hypothetical protein
MTDTRVLKITGDALKGTKRSSRRVKGQRGGYDDPPGSPITNHIPSMKELPPLIAVQPPQSVQPVQSVQPMQPVQPVQSVQGLEMQAKGGARKLDLAPKKEKLALVKSSKRSQTRKVVKIKIGHLRKSMKRARDITTDSKEKKIDEIEDILVKAGILRKREGAMSEGKQKTIRGIYRDYLQLRSNAL